MTALSIECLLPILRFPIDHVYCFATLLLGIRIVARAHHAIFMHWFAVDRIFFRIRARLLASTQVYQGWARYHILHAFFFYFFHVALVLQHSANLRYLRDVELPCFFEFLVVFYHELVILALGVVQALFVVELAHVHRFGFFYQLVTQDHLF